MPSLNCSNPVQSGSRNKKPYQFNVQLCQLFILYLGREPRGNLIPLREEDHFHCPGSMFDSESVLNGWDWESHAQIYAFALNQSQLSNPLFNPSNSPPEFRLWTSLVMDVHGHYKVHTVCSIGLSPYQAVTQGSVGLIESGNSCPT